MQNKKREKKTPTMESKIDAVYSAQWPRTDVSEDNPVLIISPPIINFQLPRIGITYDKPAIPAIKIGSTDMVYQLLLANWDTDLLWVQEQFCALFLNNANEVIGFKIFCTGALSSTHTDPSLILAVAIVSRAAKIIVAHNHPSGDNRASVGDIKVTRDLYVASKMLNIQLLDHIILARDGYTSLCNEGVIDNCLPSQSLAK